MTIYYEKKDGKIIKWTMSAEQASLEKMTNQCSEDDLICLNNGDYFLRTEALDISEQQKAQEIRIKRNRLLSESDWTQTLDAPLTAQEREKWALYRQELRDITEQQSFPNSVVYPEKK